MNKRKLHFQAERIESILAIHKAPARVTGGRVTPRLVQFHLQVAPTTKVAKVEALSEEIALALGARSARVTRSRGKLSIEVPREESATVGFMRLAEQLRRDPQLHAALQVPGTALLGLDTEGIPLLVRLASPDVTHILIAGTTGSGKSEVARTILASLVYFQKPREVQLLVLDPKGTTFKVFEALPHLLTPPIKGLDEALARLRWLEAEMEQRQAAEVTRPRIVVALDELADLLAQGGQEMQIHLARLAQRGRSAGISLVACAQKPTSAAIGSLIKANFPVRLIGRVTSADEARVASGMAATGAEKLAGRGDFILIAGGETVRFQAAYLPPADYQEFRARVFYNLNNQARPRGLLARLIRAG